MLLPELTKLNIIFFESILIPNIILRITWTKNDYDHVWFWIFCELKVLVFPIWSFAFFLYCTMSYSKVVYFIGCISPKHMRQPSRICSCHFLFIILFRWWNKFDQFASLANCPTCPSDHFRFRKSFCEKMFQVASTLKGRRLRRRNCLSTLSRGRQSTQLGQIGGPEPGFDPIKIIWRNFYATLFLHAFWLVEKIRAANQNAKK